MSSIEPYDDLDDLSCRWKIQGYGVVSEENLVKALRLYARDLQDEAEEFTKEEKTDGFNLQKMRKKMG